MRSNTTRFRFPEPKLSEHEILHVTVTMPRSDEAAMWFAAVYQAVQEVPHGKVTSYGHIANLLGYRRSQSLSLKYLGANSCLQTAERPR